VNQLKNWPSSRMQQKNEKNGEKIENTSAKEQEIFTFSDGKNGYEILEGMHPETSPGKTKTEK